MACVIRRLATAAMLILTGCNARDRIESNTPKNGVIDSSDWLAVSADAGEIADARQLAQRSADAEYEATLKLLAQPDAYLGYDELNTLNRRKDEILVRLQRMVVSPDEPAAIGAALVLCQYLKPEGRVRIAHVLEKGSSAERRRVMEGIERSWSFDEEHDRAFREFIVSDKQLTENLLQQLENADRKVVEAAVQTCGILDVPGSREKFLTMLNAEETPARDRIMYWLSRGPLTADLLEVALQTTGETPAEPGVTFGTALFEAFARQPDPKLRDRARRELKRLLANSADDDIGYSGDRLDLISTLAETSDLQDLKWLQETYERERGLYAEPLLKAIARLEGDAGRARLVETLNHETRWLIAVQVIGETFKGTGDEQLTKILSELASDKTESELLQICQSLLSIGGPTATNAVRQLMTQLEPVEQARLSHGLGSRPLSEIAARVVDSGILSRIEVDKAVERIERNVDADDSPPGLIELLAAANILIAFDAETGMLPCRHDNLVGDFATRSRGVFRPEAVNERWLQKHSDDFEAEYKLQFVHANRLYRGRLRNFGDWYDVERTVEMINQALSDDGRTERFVGLATGDQMASFVFADPARLAPIADEFDMPLSVDADAARKTGVQYEREVFERLQETE